MRAWIFSDHQYQRGDRLPGFLDMDPPEADVALVAGDAAPGLVNSLMSLAPLVARMPVVYVPGNRDFYFNSIPRALEVGREAASRLGIHLLYDEEVVVGDARVVGATLWTDYALRGTVEDSMVACARRITDHRVISVDDDGRPLNVERAAETHAASRAFVERTLAVRHEGPTVVLTHHAPHPNSVAAEYVDSPMSPGFVSDLSPILTGSDAPDLWVHGAVHSNHDYRVGRTRVVANSHGYRTVYRCENPCFVPDLVVDLDRLG